MGAPRMAQPTLPGPMPKGEGLGSVMGGGFAKSREHTGVLKLRGLPFTTTKEVWGYEVGAFLGFFVEMLEGCMRMGGAGMGRKMIAGCFLFRPTKRF